MIRLPHSFLHILQARLGHGFVTASACTLNLGAHARAIVVCHARAVVAQCILDHRARVRAALLAGKVIAIRASWHHGCTQQHCEQDYIAHRGDRSGEPITFMAQSDTVLMAFLHGAKQLQASYQVVGNFCRSPGAGERLYSLVVLGL